ncbi:MAG: hypothetical protein K8J09_04440 [Planctomycetes bacterium]|nr:hypothetical protein [Planctomycetota bacterium]
MFATMLCAACAGPELHLHNPAGHRVFLDGVLTSAETVPFRYYGNLRCDAEPADVDGRADFAHRPHSEDIELAPPASPWLFPLDFPLEVLAWVANGERAAAIAIELPVTSAAERLDGNIPPTGLGSFVDRARAARGQR